MPDAHAIHDRFRRLPGSKHIAKPLAIQGVIDTIRRQRPTSILEVGTGIGTLTHTVIRTLQEIGSSARVVSVEDNPFCLEQLHVNLKEELARVQLVTDTQALSERSFDLVIVDGGSMDRSGYADFIVPHGVALVEGFRVNQRNAMRTAARPVVFAHVRSVRPEEGGYWLVQFEPTLVDRARFAAINFRRRLISGLKRRLARVTVTESRAH